MAKRKAKRGAKPIPRALSCLPSCEGGGYHDPKCPVIRAELERHLEPPPPPPDQDPVDAEGLTPKQLLFCLHYLANGFVGAAAARSAGYSARSADSLAQQARQNLALPQVKRYLARRLRRRVQRVEKKVLDAERLDEELARLAYVDPANLVDSETGAFLGLEALDEDTRRAVRKVKVRELFAGRGANATKIGEVVEVALEPKVDAIQLGYKRLGLLKEKLEVTSKLSHEQLVLLAQKLREKKLAARAGAVGKGSPAAPARGAR